MKEFKLFVKALSKDWTLFLDRDGVINKRLPDEYVKTPLEFEFIDGVTESLRMLSVLFGRIIIVTNQQGIGKKLMSEQMLNDIHTQMISDIVLAGGKIDKVYFCPDLVTDIENCRKPGSFMAIKAKNDFPEIDFTRSVMVGDSISDIRFGKNLNMKTVFIGNKSDITISDFAFTSLFDFTTKVKNDLDLLQKKGVIC
jgi:D-glycero-D-manno-heptose 1,7-bisphosphate phosphatase